jgi:hypothetical protein
VTEIDFITAFGRLLRDGKLRDTFAVNPRAAAEEVQLRSPDLAAWLQLVPADVEFQATVLLRKRLDLIKYFAPETCRQHGEKLWQVFQAYARTCWPPDCDAKFLDAFEFCHHLKKEAAENIAMSEWNRMQFALSKNRASLHWVEQPAGARRKRRGFQFLLRRHQGGWREFFFYLGLR